MIFGLAGMLRDASKVMSYFDLALEQAEVFDLISV